MLDEAEQAVQLSIQRLRALVFELQPPGLERRGRVGRARDRARGGEREGALHYRLDDRMVAQPGVEEGAILFRVAQEALANVREHARADVRRR